MPDVEMVVISFRPNEIGLLINSLWAVRARCVYKQTGPAAEDSRDVAIYHFVEAEIGELIGKLTSAADDAWLTPASDNA